MNPETILPTLNGDHGDQAQFEALKHVIAGMIERAFACYRVVGGGQAAASSMSGKHYVHCHDNRTVIRRQS